MKQNSASKILPRDDFVNVKMPPINVRLRDVIGVFLKVLDETLGWLTPLPTNLAAARITPRHGKKHVVFRGWSVIKCGGSQVGGLTKPREAFATARKIFSVDEKGLSRSSFGTRFPQLVAGK